VRVLLNGLIYDLGDIPQISGDPQNNPTGVQERNVVLLDHSFAEIPLTHFGADYIAGGADDDVIFGQLGDDVIQGDGTIDLPGGVDAGASRGADLVNGGVNALTVTPSVENAATDGDDYIEGNGGADVIFGNLGQDDIIGGSSNLFGLGANSNLRPDGSDIIFGGAGSVADLTRNNAGDGINALDSDTIAGDNANIIRLVKLIASPIGTEFLKFTYDQTRTPAPAMLIIPRVVVLVDYTLGGPDTVPASLTTDNGAADEIHGESGDDFIYGMKGDDMLYGEGQDDDIIGGWGNDWISGGTGDDGLLGDDGRIYTSRNGTTTEPLYGIAATTQQNISTPGNIQTDGSPEEDGQSDAVLARSRRDDAFVD
jgi:Ca2+-binding RTX toxin-like protein